MAMVASRASLQCVEHSLMCTPCSCARGGYKYVNFGTVVGIEQSKWMHIPEYWPDHRRLFHILDRFIVHVVSGFS